MGLIRRQKAGTRAGANVLVVLTVVGGALAILQSAIGLFHLRNLISLALLLASAALTVAVSRARVLGERRKDWIGDRERLSKLLRKWPPGTTAEMDPRALGVLAGNPTLPPVDSLLPEYVRREDVDGLMHDAIATGRPVVLFGPARAGKSRTAYEAARSVPTLGPLVVPTNADALVALFEDEGLDLPDDGVLWLDDLARFTPRLSDPALQQLFQPGSGIRIVATMRDTQFAAMTGASGDEGEAGRRILAGAACYELRQHLTPGEHQRAIATFGDLPGHFASGIGDEVVADTAHGYVPPADGPPGPAPEPPEPPGRFDLLGWLLVGAVAACLAGAALLGILGTWTDPKQDSIDKQVEKIKHHAFVAEKKRTVADRTVTFHSGGASRLLVLRPRTGSDEIRVYDQVGDGKLTDRPFAFQPEAAATRPFRLPDDPVSGDMDGDGVQELVDAYVVHRGTHAIRIPVILAWDNNQARYQLVPVLSHAPRLPARVKGAVLHPRPFTVPFTLAHGIVHVGPAYGVTSLVVQPTEHRILVASEIGAVGLRKAILAISVFRLEPTGGAPDLRLLCSPRYRAGVVVEPVAANGASDYRAELARIARPLEAALFQERQNGKCVAR